MLKIENKNYVKLKKVLFSFFIFSFLFLVFYNFAFSASCTNSNGITTMGLDILSDPTGNSCADLSSNQTLADNVGSKVNLVVKTVLGFAATLGIIAFVYAGITILISKGNKDAYSKGMNIIKYTFIGVVIIIFSFAISNFATDTITKITGANSYDYIDNGDDCGAIVNGAYPGRCYYLLKTYIDSESLDPNIGYPSDWNVSSGVCGRDVGFCNTQNGTTYCLRCVDVKKSVPQGVIYYPSDASGKKKFR